MTADLALEAARLVTVGNPYDESDRAAYRAARQRLADALPAGENPTEHISRAIRSLALGDIARMMAGLPVEARS